MTNELLSECICENRNVILYSSSEESEDRVLGPGSKNVILLSIFKLNDGLYLCLNTFVYI